MSSTMATVHQDHEVVGGKGFQSQKAEPRRRFFMAQAVIRVFALAFAVAAICVMVTSNQTVFIYGIEFMARYSYSTSNRFLIGANAVVGAFSVLSLICVSGFWRCSSSRSPPIIFFILLLHDLVMAFLMISGCSAVTAIGYVANYGQPDMGWTAICKNTPNFCKRITISVVLSYLVLFSYMTLTVMSAHHLLSRAT